MPRSVVRSQSGRNGDVKIYFRPGRALYYTRSDPTIDGPSRAGRGRARRRRRASDSDHAFDGVGVRSHTTYDGDHIRRLTTFVRDPHAASTYASTDISARELDRETPHDPCGIPPAR